ncbi:MAG TPA: hypothetical protein VGG69_09675 [Rhizomicrobium sp.]
MAQEIHYEIYRRHGATGGWSLHDIATNRDAAIQMAEALTANSQTTGVKVVKETYHPDTGDYLSLKIFEEGHNRVKMKAPAEDLPHALPCFEPEDLYSEQARATIARVLCDYLARNRLTVSELIHRSDALEKFEATGTLFQHAIQKVGVAQAASTTAPVQQIIKSLNELVTKAIHRVYRDERRGAFPVIAAGRWAAAAEKFAGSSYGAYALNGAIAKHLRNVKGWDEKVRRLLAILDEAEGEGVGAKLLLESVDSLVAEVLHCSAALHELIGQHENLGSALMSVVQLFLGQAPADEGERAGLIALTQHFAQDRLPVSRTTVANRILAELKSVRRLCPGSPMDEFATLKQIANNLVLGQGVYIGSDDIVAAFALRSRRLVSHERIQEYLSDAATPDEKLARLLNVEENIVGAENKRQLAAFILPIVTAAPFESHFVFGKTPLANRLHRIAELQARVRRSGFQEHEKNEIADILDRIGSEVESRARLLEGIENKVGGHVEKAVALFRLFAAGMFTEGRLSGRARALVLAHLGQPGFLAGYAAQLAQDAKPDAQAAVADLVHKLEQAGIAPETGLKSIAA